MTSNNPSQPVKLGRLALFSVLGFVLAFIGSQKLLFVPGNQDAVSSLLVTVRDSFCEQGVRIPSLPCSTGEVVKQNVNESEEPMVTRFARLPDLSAVVDKLRWHGGSEADAIKLLSILQSQMTARKHQSRQNHDANGPVSKLLLPIWKDYPQLVAAASCLYCSRNFQILETLIAIEPDDIEKLNQLGANHPRFLTQISKHHSLNTDFVQKVVALQAELIAPGDSTTAEFIGQSLVAQGEFDLLKIWASKGLNGGRAIQAQNLEALPMDVVVAAWQQGVSLGYDLVELSEFLVSRGYRPALRWVVWLQGGELDYLQSWGYQRSQGRYVAMLDEKTDFPATAGVELAQFYSKNWEQIHWNDQIKRWQTVNQ